ncbi:MAG: YIP1 family protein [Deltaproteobacteria bacterium]|nr:YIP1 family protein [Deltaproteobacteria bacterium]
MSGEKIEFKKYLGKSFEILKLKGSAAIEISKDEKAFVPGLIILAIGGFASALGLLFTTGALHSAEVIVLLLFTPILNVVFFSFFLGIFHVLAKILGGQAGFMEYYRAAVFGSVITWAQVVPLIGTLVSIWSIPVNIVILENVHKLKRLEAVTIISIMMLIAMGILYSIGFFG